MKREAHDNPLRPRADALQTHAIEGDLAMLFVFFFETLFFSHRNFFLCVYDAFPCLLSLGSRIYTVQ